MKQTITILTITIPLLFSCGQDNKSTSESITKDKEASKTIEKVESQKPVVISVDEFIDTKYEYYDAKGKNLIIENSLPKGGLKYTDPDGKAYIFAVFWTQISNETDSPFELTLDFPADSFELPSSPDNYFKLFLPDEKMTIDRASLYNYGLADLDAVLDYKLQNSTSIQRTINSKETSLFYVITLFKKGVKGTIRTSLSLKDNKLYYRINDKEIQSGKYNLKNLKLLK